MLAIFALVTHAQAQLSPAITSWLQNTTETGNYYVSGNSTLIPNNILVNCQTVEYSSDYVYVHTKGVPAYPTGPFQDGNPSQAEDQDRIFKIKLNPTPNAGTLDETQLGPIGYFINGVALYDFSDGVSWNTANNALCGGPGNPPCPGGATALPWNRDAILAEMPGFDCSKGHPAMGNYHHHQNPSAFKLDINVVSTVCNLYDADGLYVIDPTEHSPLLGFAGDGYPIYGAYGYKNADGTGGISRIKSSYQLRSINVRTHHADGTDVDDGPPVDATYPLGYFRQDYEFISHTEDDYLDEHNGRFAVTPDYPNGTYAYYCTVDEDHNSAYPYAIGETFYGSFELVNNTTVTEPTTVYEGEDPEDIGEIDLDGMHLSVYPNPSASFLAIQISGVNKHGVSIRLFDVQGRVLRTEILRAGQTNCYIPVEDLYPGQYVLTFGVEDMTRSQKITIVR